MYVRNNCTIKLVWFGSSVIRKGFLIPAVSCDNDLRFNKLTGQTNGLNRFTYGNLITSWRPRQRQRYLGRGRASEWGLQSKIWPLDGTILHTAPLQAILRSCNYSLFYAFFSCQRHLLCYLHYPKCLKSKWDNRWKCVARLIVEIFKDWTWCETLSFKSGYYVLHSFLNESLNNELLVSRQFTLRMHHRPVIVFTLHFNDMTWLFAAASLFLQKTRGGQ